jgi:peptidyl-prolyl cis-trans isomerase D
MLSVFRSNTNHWLMVGVFLAITFVFVFTFGAWGGGNVSGDMPVAATVNGHTIPMSQFRVQYAQTFRTQSMFRQGYSADKAREEGLDQQVLERLISNELLAQAAAAHGLVVDDETLATTIQEQVFGKDKPFDPEEYKRLINGTYNTSEARFENQLRKDILASRMSQLLASSQHVSERELKDSFTEKNDKADLEFLKVDPNFWKKSAVEPTDDEVKTWVAANKPAVEKFYNEHMNRYRQSKKVDARHILVKVKDDASDADKKAAKAKIDAAAERVKKGEDFAAVAKEVSEDSSAAQGGSLGQFGEGAMVKPFEEAAFKLEAGQVSDVVTTKFGYHVIKVEAVVPASKKELAEVELEIGKQLRREEAQKLEAKKVADEALAELVAGKTFAELTNPAIVKPPVDGAAPPDPESVDPFAPKVDSTGMFARSARVVPRLGVAPEVVELAFKTLSLDKPLHAAVLEVNGRFFVVKLKGREQPDEAKFAAEREELEQQVIGARRAAVVEAFVNDMKGRARIEKNPKLLSAAL